MWLENGGDRTGQQPLLVAEIHRFENVVDTVKVLKNCSKMNFAVPSLCYSMNF